MPDTIAWKREVKPYITGFIFDNCLQLDSHCIYLISPLSVICYAFFNYKLPVWKKRHLLNVCWRVQISLSLSIRAIVIKAITHDPVQMDILVWWGFFFNPRIYLGLYYFSFYRNSHSSVFCGYKSDWGLFEENGYGQYTRVALQKMDSNKDAEKRIVHQYWATVNMVWY